MAKNLADVTGARGTKHTNGNGNGHGKAKGLRFGRFFTPAGSHAYDLVEWERRTAAITGEKGQVIFEQKDVEVPRSWSQLAINVVAQTEGMLFKFGSGTGTNLSVLRSSKEQLSGGGTASGPVSFMKGYDSFAGSIKSGGTTRRAAKMVILNADHPDVMDFITCKAGEEKKAWALIDAGYEAGFNIPGGAYDSVQFQNANHSVRVPDEFMNAVLEDGEWTTHAVTDRREVDRYRARDVMRAIAESAWICGDPGMQNDSTIQHWNGVSNTGP